jgi:predicted nucleotidyltransferase
MQKAASNNQNTPIDRYLRKLKQELLALASCYHVKSLALFGSYVRGEQESRSDLDVLVEFSETPDIFQFMELEQHLAQQLGVKVDLVSRKSLKGRIGQRIEHEMIPL